MFKRWLLSNFRFFRLSVKILFWDCLLNLVGSLREFLEGQSRTRSRYFRQFFVLLNNYQIKTDLKMTIFNENLSHFNQNNLKISMKVQVIAHFSLLFGRHYKFLLFLQPSHHKLFIFYRFILQEKINNILRSNIYCRHVNICLFWTEKK